MNTIDYSLISQAISFYEMHGFKYIEVPWIVSEEALSVTLPKGRTGLHCADGALVGSAEQSFIHMALEGKLKSGRYVAASPCFRDDVPDEWHQRSFFKVELIDIMHAEVVETMWERDMAWIALSFFQRFEPEALIERVQGETIDDPGHLDITLGGIELGSYGDRRALGWTWTYGTGLAEPRFSMARAALKR